MLNIIAVCWLWNKTERRPCERNEADKEVWLLANTKQFGFYRVNYEISNWQLLISQLLNQHDKLDSITRAQLIDDAFTFSSAKMLPFELAMNLTTYLLRERNYLPWNAALSHFDFIESHLSFTSDCWTRLRVSFLTSYSIYELHNKTLLIIFVLAEKSAALFHLLNLLSIQTVIQFTEFLK